MQANPAHTLQGTWRTIAKRRPLLMTLAVTGWSIKYLVDLGLTHTTGAEIYGVATAALAVGTAIASLKLLTTPRTWALARLAVIVLFALVAIAGVAGTVAHVIGPVPGHGPIDLRPRPIAAPLVFTLLGFVGGAAQYLGYRASVRRVREPGEE